jgi:hypothetical protein
VVGYVVRINQCIERFHAFNDKGIVIVHWEVCGSLFVRHFESGFFMRKLMYL